MSQIKNVLINGGGISGLTLAAGLAQRGVEVTVLEKKDKWEALGCGIIQQPNQLRALKAIGIVDQCRDVGFGIDYHDMWNQQGTVRYGSHKMERLENPQKAAMNCLRREDLSNILVEAAENAGATIKLGTSLSEINQDSDGVHAVLSNGEKASYDLLVGADGLRSHVRQMSFGRYEPEYTGLVVTRFIAERPKNLTALSQYQGRGRKIGLVPLSEELMYLFTVTPEAYNTRKDPSTFVDYVRETCDGFGGPIPGLVSQLHSADQVIWSPLEEVHMPPKWHNGRVVLVGDAAHAGSPFLAQGAAMAVEDAIVLMEEIVANQTHSLALENYMKRRYERAAWVQSTSIGLGRSEANSGFFHYHIRNIMLRFLFKKIMAGSDERLAQPI